MLIGVLGSPITGKTTLAAGLFAKLKEMGVACEFVPEYARKYIATQREIWGEKALPLDDQDQREIADGQRKEENLFLGSGTEVVVTDGSVANAHFYLENVSDRDRAEMIGLSLERYDVVFFARPFEVPCVVGWDPLSGKSGEARPDPNRVHSADFSFALDRTIEKTLYTLTMAGFRPAGVQMVELHGNPSERLTAALRAVTLRLETKKG